MQVETKLTEIEDTAPRWAKFYHEYLKNGNAYRSAVKAGFSKEYAKVITSRMPRAVRESLKQALEKQGLTTHKIASRIRHLVESNDTVAVDKGLTHVLKIRGEYKEAETPVQKHVHLHVDLSSLRPEQIEAFAQTGKIE